MFKWYRQFSDGQDSLEEQKGRERNIQTYGTTICDALVAYRRLTIRELVERLGMGYDTIQWTLTEILQISKMIPIYEYYSYEYGRTFRK